MPSAVSRALPPLLRLAGLRRPFAAPAAMQQRLHDVALRPARYGPPPVLRGVDVTVGRSGGWPVCTVRPRGAGSGQHAVYVHGGSWAFEISPFHWWLVAWLVRHSGVTVAVPVYPLAGDLAGLGPLTVFGGSLDITHPDVRLLVERVRAAGVEVDDQDAPGMVHVWPLLPVPEGRAARRHVAGLLRA